ncbi:acyltransferase family protein [Clostridium felsineum]|uniref:Uncharacterized protein n=1 Tax=Clostridium felsineum TaxID=36839 RepID=A0A1S8L7Y9_9CLOT|nr:acyltransferase family protein [Clostridium felsineum]MCR3757913.1 acyltransferase family protein [Clostridium felsineum]URZ08109.1 hypothetical protein CLROS_034750 [Clostridium felsineum]URZ13140.1 hypothetical protein CROST_038900 [Clostridium felsineum]
MERNRSIDIAKGIGILLVLLGHRSIPDIMVKFIYSFHIPLFFLISGYLYRDKGEGYFLYVKHKFKTIIVPYIFFWIISLGIQLIAMNFNILSRVNGKELISEFFYLTPNGFWNGPLWFLVCLFVVYVLYYPVNKLLYNRKFYFIFIGLFLALGWSVSEFKIYLPLKLDVAFTGIAFYIMGDFAKNIKIKFKLNTIPMLLIMAFLTLILSIGLNNTIVQMIVDRYGNYLVFIVTSLTGSLSIIILSNLIGEFKLLEWLGKNSLAIMGLHFIIFIVILDPIQSALKLPLGNFFFRSLVTLVDIGICLAVLKPIIEAINKYLPFIFGKNVRRKGGLWKINVQ